MNAARGALRREACQSLRSGRGKTWSSLAVIMLCVLGSVVAELSTVAALRTAEDAWVEAGGRLVLASSDGGISSTSCEDAGRLGGVAASVSLERTPQVVESIGAPGEAFGLGVASPSILTFFALSNAAGDELLLSPRVSALVPGPTVVLRDAPFRESSATGDGASALVPGHAYPVLRDVPLGSLGPEFERTAVAVDGRPGFREHCIVRADPGQVAAVAAVLASQLETRPGDTLTVRRGVALGQLERDFGAEFDSRAIAALPWLAALVVGLFAVAAHWMNRTENAVYAIVGLDDGQIDVLRTLQWLLTWALASVAALLGWWIAWRWFGSPEWGPRVLLRVLTCSFAGSTLIFLATLRLFRTDVLTALKDN